MVIVNYVAILVAGIASMIIGMAWYSPNFFGKKWMHAIGMKMPNKSEMKAMQKKMMPSYLAMYVGAAVTAYVLSLLLGNHTLMDGVMLGFWVWLGFFATSALSHVFFEGRSWTYYYVVVGHHLVNLIVMGAIIGSL